MEKNKIFIQCTLDLTIRIVTPDDVNNDYLDTFSDESSVRYLGESRWQTQTINTLKNFAMAQLNSDNSYLFGLYDNDYLIATSRAHDIINNEAWQGVLVFKNFQKQGFGRLIVSSVSDYIMESLNLKKISAGILEANIASQRLFHKAGFSYGFNDPDDLTRQVWIKKSA